MTLLEAMDRRSIRLRQEARRRSGAALAAARRGDAEAFRRARDEAYQLDRAARALSLARRAFAPLERARGQHRRRLYQAAIDRILERAHADG